MQESIIVIMHMLSLMYSIQLNVNFLTSGRVDRGPINSFPSVCPSVCTSVRLQQAFLENASFNFSETWHEVRVL